MPPIYQLLFNDLFVVLIISLKPKIIYTIGECYFIITVLLDIKELSDLIEQNYPRVPQGLGNTSVEISFGNGVIVRISPLSKSILAIQGNNTIEYNWSDIL